MMVKSDKMFDELRVIKCPWMMHEQESKSIMVLWCEAWH
jgi:hypothetical protein